MSKYHIGLLSYFMFAFAIANYCYLRFMAITPSKYLMI